MKRKQPIGEGPGVKPEAPPAPPPATNEPGSIYGGVAAELDRLTAEAATFRAALKVAREALERCRKHARRYLDGDTSAGIAGAEIERDCDEALALAKGETDVR